MAKQPRILAGETAAVTGAARGIGRATAQGLIAHGMRVAIGDVDAAAAAATAAELGPSAVGLAPARRMIDINLHGVIFGMNLALARMIPRDRGHIVNISSQAGKFGAPGGATYSATKHAVVGLTEAIRGEMRRRGTNIDVSYVMPFVVNTELGSGLGEARGLTSLEPGDVAEA